MNNFKDKANLIWQVADLLRGDYRQSDYGKVILPMTVLRRLDCILAPTKDKVLKQLPEVEKMPDKSKDAVLNKEFKRSLADENVHILDLGMRCCKNSTGRLLTRFSAVCGIELRAFCFSAGTMHSDRNTLFSSSSP